MVFVQGFTYGIHLLTHKAHAIETYHHFTSPSERKGGTLIAIYNTIIIIIWKQAMITNHKTS